MDQYSIREVVEQAVQTEKLGYEYYNSMSAKFPDNDKVSNLFNVLAEQELIHEKRFSELKESLSKDQLFDWDEVSKYLHAIVESEFFLGNEKALASMKEISTVNDAIRYAIGFEKETLLYYHALKDAVQEKNILDEIISEEKKHILWLSDLKKVIL